MPILRVGSKLKLVGIGLRLLLGSCVFLWFLNFFSAQSVYAVDSERVSEEAGKPKADDDYNFNWLDPEKKIYVLQNRKYLKSEHVLMTVMGGVGFSNPYRNTINLDPRISYYINETWGIEAFYTNTFNFTNSTYTALTVAAPNTLPSIREIHAQIGGELHFVPWYAKINVFNSILYFDWYFGLGGGLLQTFVNTSTTVGTSIYQENDLMGVFVSTGHLYHLSQNLIVRIDMTAALYPANINGLTGASTWYTNLNFGLGLGWKF